MDIQKERDLYLAELLEREVITQYEFRDFVFKPEINAFDSNYLSSWFIDKINFGWSVWQAKAQAVPEGFVLVPKEPTDEIIEAMNEFDYRNDYSDMDGAYRTIVETLEKAQEDAERGPAK